MCGPPPTFTFVLTCMLVTPIAGGFVSFTPGFSPVITGKATIETVSPVSCFAVETVKTVSEELRCLCTGLKPGVNEMTRISFLPFPVCASAVSVYARSGSGFNTGFNFHVHRDALTIVHNVFVMFSTLTRSPHRDMCLRSSPSVRRNTTCANRMKRPAIRGKSSVSALKIMAALAVTTLRRRGALPSRSGGSISTNADQKNVSFQLFALT
jgi:hypothetical protein